MLFQIIIHRLVEWMWRVEGRRQMRAAWDATLGY